MGRQRQHYGYGRCPRCACVVPLTEGRTLKRHRWFREWMTHGEEDCPGTGGPPVGRNSSEEANPHA